MATEKPSFLSTPKGIITVVLGVIGGVVMLIVGFGFHQGWFSDDSTKSTPANSTPANSTSANSTTANSSTTDSVVKKPTGSAGDAEKNRILSQEPSDAIANATTSETITKIFDQTEVTEADCQLLYSLLPHMDSNEVKNCMITRQSPTGIQVTVTSSLKKRDILEKILPEDVKTAMMDRERALESFFSDPDNQNTLTQCNTTHRVLFEALSTSSEFIKKELNVESEDLCTSYGPSLFDEIRTSKLLNLFNDTGSDVFRRQNDALWKQYSGLQKICPDAYSGDYDSII